MSQQALTSLLAIVLLPLLCHINFAQTKITFIEVKFPLLVISCFDSFFFFVSIEIKLINGKKTKNIGPRVSARHAMAQTTVYASGC
jgi:hypothetical protein